MRASLRSARAHRRPRRAAPRATHPCSDRALPLSSHRRDRDIDIDSYLDSVSFFEPRWLRTPVYHEILVGYLANIKERGFVCAHIWACPPTRGSDYIFHRHPREQKTPGWERLQRWYEQMLQQALTEGTVVEVSNLYRDHFERFVPAHLAAQSVRLPGRLLKLKPQAVAGGDSAAAFAPPFSAAGAAKAAGAAVAGGAAGRRSSRQPKKTKKFGEESAATAMVVSAEDRKARQRAAAKRKALADFPPSLALGSRASSVLPVGPAPLLPGHFWIQQVRRRHLTELSRCARVSSLISFVRSILFFVCSYLRRLLLRHSWTTS